MIETTTKTHLAHGIEKTEYLAQYDDSVKELLQEKHQMVMMRDLQGGIHTMCNVGEGVWERAEAAGMKKGELKGRLEGISALVKSLRKFGATDEQIIVQMMEELGLTEAVAKEYFDKVN